MVGGYLYYFFFNNTATTEIYTYVHTLSLHDALPILSAQIATHDGKAIGQQRRDLGPHEAILRISVESLHRSEEHTSELQSLMRISYAVFCLKKKILLYTN